MAEQVPLSTEASAIDPERDAARRDRTHQIAPDLAYRRLGIVNVVFYGEPNPGDRGWVLIDAGIVGTKHFIETAASERFATDARPAAIVPTHGHFDHVGALEHIAAQWDAPVYAHPLGCPTSTGGHPIRQAIRPSAVAQLRLSRDSILAALSMSDHSSILLPLTGQFRTCRAGVGFTHPATAWARFRFGASATGL